ncbi:MAG: amino acid adenylation domain-containing protein [Limnoraphis robusta]
MMINTEKMPASFNHTLSASAQLSPLQRAYFVGQQPSFDLHVHPHLYLEFDLDECDSQALTQALNILIARHEILRAVVLPTGEIYVVEDTINYQIPEQNLCHLNGEETTQKLAEIRQTFYRADLQSDTPPNIEVQITRLPNFTRVHINIDLLFLDGTSVRMVLHELSEIYTNPNCCLPKISFDLCGYDAYIQQKRATERYQRAKNYWFERLKTLPEGPTFPLVSQLNSARRSQLIRRKHVLSAQQWEIICQRAKTKEISPTTLLLTAYSLIIAYWSKTQHYSLTMMVQNRDREFADLSRVLGNFASTILVEVDFREAKSFQQHSQEIHRQVFRDLARSMICGLDVLQERNRQDGAAFHAASPVAFVSMLAEPGQPIPSGIFQLEGEKVAFCGLETPQVIVDHQAISRPDGGVSLIWDTMDSAFETGVLDDMFNAYVSLVSSFAENDTVWNQSYFDFRSQEQQQNHTEYNQVSAPLLSDYCLHEYLYEQAEKLPNKPLIIDSRRTITYAEALALSNQIAWTLRQQYQVQPNELIAIYAAKGWEQIIAAQAILAAGAAYVPIDPAFPENRKLNVLQRCGCRIVLTSQAHLNDDCLGNLTKIAVDCSENLVAEFSNLPRIQSSDDLAYVIFTSGSTGQPKGVMLNHLGPVNTIEDINRRFKITADDVIFGISELSFDLSVYDIFGSIAAGATLVLPPVGANREPALCTQLCEKYGVTVWNSVPALAHLLVEYLERNRVYNSLSIRLVMMSGDWIPVQLPDKLKQILAAKVVSLGGATEASIWSIYYEIDGVDSTWTSIPYGYPLSNQSFYVLDERLQPRPDNIPGELYIGGVGVAEGYWQDSEKTTRSFITHPISQERIYRTGDWGVRRSPGYIDFLGRKDGQVKVRGHRIELGEIESVLQRHHGVANAVAKVIGERPQEAYIAAYIVAKEGETILSEELQKHATEFLPEYMIPTRFVFMNQLPLGATGKVDRKALPIPQEVQHADSSELPRTPTEQKLAILWSEVLEIDKLHREDHFFELGGNSFTAVRLTAAISDRFGVELPVTMLLQHPTLAKLAEFIDKHNKNSTLSRSHLVSIAGQETHPKVFWFHPSGGGILCYQDLGKLLSAQFQFYGVQAQSDHQYKPMNSIPEMAEVYLQEIRAIQPSAPYRLGGWSMGGVIAYEAAQQLIKQGVEVEHLVLIDSPAPRPRKQAEFKTLVSWFVSDVAEAGELFNLDCLRVNNDSEDIVLAALKEAQQRGFIPSGNLDNLRPLFDVFCANLNALHRYQALPLTVDIPCLLVMATQNIHERVANESQEIWSSLLPKHTTFSQVEGNHFSLLKSPAVSQLSKLIFNGSSNPNSFNYSTLTPLSQMKDRKKSYR